MKAPQPKRRILPHWFLTNTSYEAGDLLGSFNKQIIKIDARDMFDSVAAQWKIKKSLGDFRQLIRFITFPFLVNQILHLSQIFHNNYSFNKSRLGILLFALNASASTAMSEPAASWNILQRQVILGKQLSELFSRELCDNVFYSQCALLLLAAGNCIAAENLLLHATHAFPADTQLLQTLARFYVHVGRAHIAYKLVIEGMTTNYDPALLATAIALSDAVGLDQIHLETGWKVLNKVSPPSVALSELAAAVGGAELRAGNERKARNAYLRSMLVPTPNVSAQVIMFQDHVDIDVQDGAAPVGNEAQLLLALRALDINSAEIHASNWLKEEPFSSRPVQFLMSIYFSRGHYAEAAAAASAALLADSLDASLLASRAFALAAAGQFDLARQDISVVRSSGCQSLIPVVTATEAWIALHNGHIAAGENLYRSAIVQFEANGDMSSRTSCLAFYARAATEIGHPSARVIYQEAFTAFQHAIAFDAALMLSGTVHSQSAPIAALPRPLAKNWMYDPHTNTLTKR